VYSRNLKGSVERLIFREGFGEENLRRGTFKRVTKGVERKLFNLPVNGMFIAPFAVLSELYSFGVLLGVFGCYVVSPFALGASQRNVYPFGSHLLHLSKFF
jgi:hypothetical protein